MKIVMMTRDNESCVEYACEKMHLPNGFHFKISMHVCRFCISISFNGEWNSEVIIKNDKIAFFTLTIKKLPTCIASLLMFISTQSLIWHVKALSQKKTYKWINRKRWKLFSLSWHVFIFWLSWRNWHFSNWIEKMR